MNSFSNYMKEFNEKDINEKKKEVYIQLKLLSNVTSELSASMGNNIDFGIKEDFYGKQVFNQDDVYLTKLLILISSIQNSLADYTNSISNILENMHK